MDSQRLPLATAYNICEDLGFESGINKRFSEAKLFYSQCELLIVLGAGFILIPWLPLLNVILFSQVANGILLPLDRDKPGHVMASRGVRFRSLERCALLSDRVPRIPRTVGRHRACRPIARTLR